MSNGVPANLHVVCPKHGRHSVSEGFLRHIDTPMVASFKANETVEEFLRERRMTPYIICPGRGCWKTFTNYPRSPRYDIMMDIQGVEDDDSDYD